MNNESDTSSFASTFQRETTMSEIDPNALNQNTPVIQNFIDFRPVFDGFHKINEENLDRSARQITEVDNRVIIELKEINDKVMDKVSLTDIRHVYKFEIYIWRRSETVKYANTIWR